jgi:hypothetical protein
MHPLLVIILVESVILAIATVVVLVSFIRS